MFNTSFNKITVFVIVCAIIILLLISFIMFIIYKYQHRQNIYFENLQQVKMNHENSLLQTQLEIQEQTLEHLSKEIHDNLGQKLTLAKLQLNTLNVSGPGPSSELDLLQPIQLIGQVITDLSQLSHSMSSEILLHNGIIEALKNELNQLNRSKLFSAKLEITGEPYFLDTNKELLVFRIFQEALNNIVKHAEATAITIRLTYAETGFTMELEDDGKGFDLTDEGRDGIGLHNMEKRARILKGELIINSLPGKGTTITTKIPI